MAHGEKAVSVSCCHLVENIITLCWFSSPCPHTQISRGEVVEMGIGRSLIYLSTVFTGLLIAEGYDQQNLWHIHASPMKSSCVA